MLSGVEYIKWRGEKDGRALWVCGAAFKLSGLTEGGVAQGRGRLTPLKATRCLLQGLRSAVVAGKGPQTSK